MLLPIDTTPLRFLLTGEPTVVLDYETRLPRTDAAGRPLLRVPVVVTGTGEKRAPAVEVTVPGPLAEVEQGSLVAFTGLALRTWSVRGTDGRAGCCLRSGSPCAPHHSATTITAPPRPAASLICPRRVPTH